MDARLASSILTITRYTTGSYSVRACVLVVQVVWDKVDWIANAFGLAPWYARRDDNTMVCTS